MRVDERLWLPGVALSTLLGPALATVVLPGPLSGSVLPLALGVLAQLLATVLVGRLDRYPHLGLAAVVVVAAALHVADSPWQRLLAEQAVPWVPLALAWATVRIVGGARTPRQLRVSGLLAVGYVVVISAGGGAAGSAAFGAAVPFLGGTCVSLAIWLQRARRDRVAALSRERAALADRARAGERQALAAQVHDTLGHVLTLLVLHANVLAVSATTDPAARATGEQMSRLGNDGLTELRRILALMDAPASGPPRVSGPVRPEVSIRALAEQAREAGQEIRLDLPDELPTFAPATAGALSRAAQEGLTNARRHAPGSEIRVQLAAVGQAMRLSVCNGPAADAAGGLPGSGRGLAAMRRRIILLGGDCVYGPTADGGYALSVTLPLGAKWATMLRMECGPTQRRCAGTCRSGGRRADGRRVSPDDPGRHRADHRGRSSLRRRRGHRGRYAAPAGRCAYGPADAWNRRSDRDDRDPVAARPAGSHRDDHLGH